MRSRGAAGGEHGRYGDTQRVHEPGDVHAPAACVISDCTTTDLVGGLDVVSVDGDIECRIHRQGDDRGAAHRPVG